MNLLEELDEFIDNTKEVLEHQRALAAKLSLERHPTDKIQKLLQVSKGFISHWKSRVICEGVEALRVQYKGTDGALKRPEREAVIQKNLLSRLTKPEMPKIRSYF